MLLRLRRSLAESMAGAMATPQKRHDEALTWCWAIALAFLAFTLHRLTIPSRMYFDEIHYVKAARELLTLTPANREHPMFAKELIAASIALLGDRPLAWRLPSALFGALGIFAFGRLVWIASKQRMATILAMVLMATSFMWFIASRIAMLDMVCASLALVGLWQFAAALESERPRRRLLIAGVALGLSLGSKWSAAPVAMLPGLYVLWLRATKQGHHDTLRGVSLFEAALWLGLLPLLVYWATYAPALFYEGKHQLQPLDFIRQHKEMFALQDSVKKPHTYQSYWWQWVFNIRPIWFLYEPVDGAQRGILMLGNPFSMLVGLPALAWALWAGVMRQRRDALAMALLYIASLAMWPVSGKPVQFYFHYLLPGTFLMGCLALAISEMLTRGRTYRIAAVTMLIITIAVFAWFYPIISAAELHNGRKSFETWMWLASWR